MPPLEASFEEVADWCERHLEATRGREIGMTFGAAVRACGHLAVKPDHLHDDQDVLERRVLNEKAEEVLLNFCTRFLVAYGWKEDKSKRLAEPSVQLTNMTYDPGPRKSKWTG